MRLILLSLLLLSFASRPLWGALGQNPPIGPGERVNVQWEELKTKLVQAAKPADRDTYYQALSEDALQSSEARRCLVEALSARWQAAMTELGKQGLEGKFARLLQQRTDLDSARKAALAVIEDEERYFYPYNPPDVTPEKAATYHKVQQEVDQKIAAVQALWGKSVKVKVNKNLASVLSEIAWLQDQSGWMKEAFAYPAATPAWIQYLPADQKQWDLTNFPLDGAEAARLERDRRVSVYNERIWSECKLPQREKTEEDRAQTAQYPSELEREQVRVTNGYRLMLGRPALTWDPLLQAATHGHSEYQSRTGNFGHFQGDGPTKTPFDRMRLVGYTRGVSENCHKGSGDPKSAHNGWCHSSGHHRNLIAPGHLQMASSVSGDVWTQNFGVDNKAEAKL